MTLKEYPLFIAMTRPSMMLGVTLSAFVTNITACLCFAVVSKELILTAGLFLILHIVGIVGCSKDERYFEILLGKFDLVCPNRNFWGCNSYDPE